jgi:phosphoglycolate phosphatase
MKKGHVIFDCDGTLVKADGKLYPEIKDLLINLKAEGHELYIWTGRDRSSTQRLLRENEIQSYFFDMRCSDDVSPKPNPEGPEQLLAGIVTDKVVVIGDSFADILGAKNFKCRSIGAGWDLDAKIALLREMGADSIATSPLECNEILKLWWG